MDTNFLGVEILSWIGVAATILYLVVFVVFSYYRWQEEKFIIAKEKEIIAINNKPITMASIEGQIRNVVERYRPILESIERRKKFLIDVIPFFRK